MGYKINPISFRIGFKRNWNSFWFGSYDYQRLLEDDLQIRSYLEDICAREKVPHGNVYIRRSVNKDLVVSMPRYNPSDRYMDKLPRKPDQEVISAVGQNKRKQRLLLNSLKRLTGQTDSHFTVQRTKYKGSSFFFTIPVKNAQLIAHYVAYELQKRNPFHEIMQDIMDWVKETKDFAGIIVQCSGRSTGKDRTQALLKKRGNMPYSTMSSKVDYGFSDAFTVSGASGVKVWLFLNPREKKDDSKSKENEILKISKRFNRGNRH